MTRKRQKTSPLSAHFDWKVEKWPEGTMYVNYPSPLARQLCLYVRSIGRVRHDVTFRHGHRHEDGFLLHFVARGALWHQVRGRSHVAHAGEACLLDISDDVRYGNAGPEDAEFFWVLFNSKDMPRIFAELRADQDPLFRTLDGPRLTAVFSDLIAITRDQPPGAEWKGAAALTSMLGELFICRDPKTSFASMFGHANPPSDAVRKGVDCICRHYDVPLAIKAIATASGQSASYFSRQFHREVGMTPREYLNRFRIEQAKLLLSGTDKPIKGIAHSVGFPDENHFTRVFAQINGLTPRVYRRSQSKAAPAATGPGAGTRAT
jgi:AraC-like DNA-binding protein